MLGIDERIAELGGGSLAVTLAVAVLLGLRHATDPDHLTAVCTLALTDGRAGARRAGGLGLAWGAGHGVTMLALGLPVIAFGAHLPDAVTRTAELAVGALIILLAVRLLLRWRRGTLHVHPHRHGDRRHAHPHVHEHAHGHLHDDDHAHAHDEALGRTPLAAFGIGLVHGVGGSAGVGILVVAGAAPGAAAAVALVALAAGTVAAMVVVSAAFGRAIMRQRADRLARVVPAYGVAGLAFGGWYVLAALQTAPYPF